MPPHVPQSNSWYSTLLILSAAPSCSFVLAAVTSTFFVNTLHMLRTSKFRKASGVKYPAAYATDEQAQKNPAAATFNCGMATQSPLFVYFPAN